MGHKPTTPKNPSAGPPAHLRESVFRTYETHIAEGIAAVKDGVSITVRPNAISATTFAARLRDAILSYATFKWPSAHITPLTFEEHYPKLRVCHLLNGDITIGVKSNAKRDALLATLQHDRPDLTIEAPDEPTLAALALLCSKRILGRVTLNGPVNTEFLSLLTRTHDISLTNDKDSILML